ncbi:MAG: ABC transporter permease [Bryobacteraceae bacterium]
MNLWAQLRRWRGCDKELDEEIRAHLAMAARDHMERGENRVEAAQSARRELGNELLVKEVTREVWGFAALERFGQDLKYALRQMRRSPAFSTIAVLTLALGLGATTTMFSIVNGVLLQPLKYRDPGRLYLARTLPPAHAGLRGDFPVNARQYYEWRTHCRSCEAVSLAQFEELTLVGAGQPVKLPALGVSSNFFSTLGVQPALGRDFLPGEDAPGHFGEVILTDALWRSRFAADPSVLGRAIQVNGEPHTVVGVMPRGLHLPKGDEWGGWFGPEEVPLIFRPLGVDALRARPAGNLNYTSVIRLKPGISSAQAIAELNALLSDMVRQFQLETTITLIPLRRQVTRDVRSSLWLLLGTVGAVLLIVCVNVGNLMLIRTTGRYREAAVRMALGATRAQLFSLVLKEALLLIAIGGVGGLLVSYAGLKVFVATAPAGLPRLDEVQMDWRVLAFAGLAMGFSAIAGGLFPAWRLAGIEIQHSLKAGAATSTETGGKLRVREILVSVEVALSTALLISGGLLMLSFFRVMHVDKGFEIAHVITQDVSYVSPKYSHGARRGVVERTLAELSRIPGVEAAAAINLLPLRGDDWVGELEDPDQPKRAVEDSALANFRFASPGYWKTMGIPLRMGRFLDSSDKGRPTAVVSEQAARYLWPNQNPLGKHVRGVGPQSPSLQVVGVVGEVRASRLDRSPPMMVYEHYWRMQPVGMSFVLRTQANPLAVAGSIRSVLSSADPEMAIAQPTTMEQIVEKSVATRKFQMGLAAVFALSALALASLGIYGVISFAVARRTSEIGIRVALGASRRRVLTMILWQGMRPVLVGLAAGIPCALFLSRLIASQLFGVEPWDLQTIGGVTVLLMAVGAAACSIPARRATQIDPLAALRFE